MGSNETSLERKITSGSLAESGVLLSTNDFRTRSISIPERTSSCPVVVFPSRVAMSCIVMMLQNMQHGSNERLRSALKIAQLAIAQLARPFASGVTYCRLRTRPGRAPLGLLSRQTVSPLTSTVSMPFAAWIGLEKLAASSTSSALKMTMSAA